MSPLVAETSAASFSLVAATASAASFPFGFAVPVFEFIVDEDSPRLVDFSFIKGKLMRAHKFLLGPPPKHLTKKLLCIVVAGQSLLLDTVVFFVHSSHKHSR